MQDPIDHIPKTENREPLPDHKVYEGPFTKFWLDSEGILHAQSQPVLRTLEGQKQTIELIRRITGNKKVCMLADTTRATTMDKPTRTYVATQMPSIFKAVAVISNSTLGRFFGNMFMGLRKNEVPMKLFSTETEAMAWLRQYL